MPWTMESALRHTHKAKSKGAKKQWSAVANKILQESGDDAKAIRIANAAVKKRGKHKKAA
jgi:hypothetical protein